MNVLVKEHQMQTFPLKFHKCDTFYTTVKKTHHIQTASLGVQASLTHLH